MKSILSVLTLGLFLNISSSVGAFEGKCIQGNCKNGYGIFASGDGRVYEGLWKNGLFDGMGKLTFISGSKYTGEFKKGLMHGYGKINLPNGEEKRCEVINGEIQVDDSTRQLWIKGTDSEVDENIVYLQIGDIYRKLGNYEKSLEYYNKSLSINADHEETVNKKKEVEQKIADLEAKAKELQPPKIVIQSSVRPGPGRTKLYGSSSTSTAKKKSTGTATAKSDRGYQVPAERINRLKKAALGSGHHVSSGPAITTDSAR